jgi:flagellar protein FliS
MATRSYEEYRVLTASPLARVRLLYDKMIAETGLARECLRSNDPEGRARHVNSAFSVVTELILSLKPETALELTSRLKQVYEYVQWRLVTGHAQRDGRALEEVQALMRSMREVWEEPVEETPEPEMAVAEARQMRPSNPYARQESARRPNYL